MDLLADMSVVIWAMMDDLRLGRAKPALADPQNRVCVSVASAWEMAIKVSLGKLRVGGPLPEWLPGQLAALRFAAIPIDLTHALAVERLPFHHRDPFDRLLIAQAIAEGLTIVTSDRWFELYGVPLIQC